MTDFVEMFRHWNAGRSQVQIYEALTSPAIVGGSGWRLAWRTTCPAKS